jgi:predicted ATP-dependent protease
MGRPGYNMYVVRPRDTDIQALVTDEIREAAAARPTPDDLCYVRNFRAAETPRALMLPAGRGEPFRAAVEALVKDIGLAIQAAFESEEFQTQRQALEEDFSERPEKVLSEIGEKAKAKGIAVLRTPRGMAFAPLGKGGDVMPPQEFEKLPAKDREAFNSAVEELQADLQKAMRQVPRWQRELRDRALDLGRSTTRLAAEELVTGVKEQFGDSPAALDWLDLMLADITERGPMMFESSSDDDGTPVLSTEAASTPASVRYAVNLLVAHETGSGAPVIYVDNPTYADLVGRVERQVQMGALVTDHTMVRPGALHRANGGYLLVEALRLLQQPLAYDALKRALRSKCIRIESIEAVLSLVTTVSLEPQPVDLDVKVVLLGDRSVFYLLSQFDQEFDNLFKVLVDAEETVDYDHSVATYAEALAVTARQEELLPLDRLAVAAVVEHSSRVVSDQHKLAPIAHEVRDLMREADHWARSDGSDVISAPHVARARVEADRRIDRVRDDVQEHILRGSIMIATDGSRVGQVNGLSVLSVGKLVFGQPSRITARVSLGKGEVLNIEREVELSGPLHSKGVLILEGFLRGRYAKRVPLSLSATLVFEQSYGGVDGDSASSTELYALLSEISGLPLAQSIAVTGSVSQFGDVQPIGGVNEKIEGFFDICSQRGLTGSQGVLIPAANVKNLMLREDVVEAVAAGRFRVHAVEHIDQGMEILTGVPAGAPAADGSYPAGTVNAAVLGGLEKLAELRRSHDDPASRGAE